MLHAEKPRLLAENKKKGENGRTCFAHGFKVRIDQIFSTFCEQNQAICSISLEVHVAVGRNA
jgi:mRNA deadenylase 3'-5' endonuclease subunit Ccr4